MLALIAPALFAVLATQQLPIPPAPRGYGTNAAEVVVDAAGVLTAETVNRLNQIAFDVHRKSGGEMAIVTLPDLKGRDVAEVALAIGRAWGVGAKTAIGDRARNAGVVILVVPKESSSDGRGHIRIETGRGTEGFITDAQAGDIQREAIPDFQRRDYDGALLLVGRRVAERFASEFQFELDTTLAPPEPAPSFAPGATRGIPPFPVFVVLVVIFFALVSAAGRGRRRGGCNGCLTLLWAIQAAQPRRRGGWGGGGFGGGSFGGGGGFGGFGGGGGFSGGGSSGSW